VRWHTRLLTRACVPSLRSCAELEAAGYPSDEAASPERLAYRQREAGPFFLVAHSAEADAVCGFVCGTCTSADGLTAETMATHDPDGTTLCVHSVCVAGDARRRGVASALLRTYLQLIIPGVAPAVRCVRLIAKPYLTKLYLRAGFRLVGPSSVVHGAEQWNEFVHEYEAQEAEA
jgi:ribosomal protein S18 acetylase RimI-like enzyme